MRDLFISYAAEDSSLSLKIVKGLEGAGYTAWYYERDSVAGIPHPEQTSAAIEGAQATILIISTHSLASHEVGSEVEHLYTVRKPIIPLLVDIPYDEIKRKPLWQRTLGARVALTVPNQDIKAVLPGIIRAVDIILAKGPREPERRRHLKIITPPEPNFVGRTKLLDTITGWYRAPDIHIGTLIGLGGDGKSSIAREWYDRLEENGIKPDGIFWWGFYRNAYLDRFLDSLLKFLYKGRANLSELQSTWAKVDMINDLSQEGEYLIILDGFEEMQKGTECDGEFGCIQHQELTEILSYWANANVRGLCLITSRYPLKDFKNYEMTTCRRKNVGRLSVEDGRLLFEKIGVEGTQRDIDKVIKEYDGHALSLTLLAKSIVEYFDGDITQATKIPKPTEPGAGGDARRILEWYASQLTPAQLAFLNIFSLFREEVDENDFTNVFCSEMGTAINKPLISMKPYLFRVMIGNLCDKHLISKGQDDTYTAHPLIKGYFKSIMREDDKIACHRKIYGYIGTYASSSPDTIEECIPLIEQVHHGCKGGLFDGAFDVYRNKMQRMDAFYLVYRLGAWETNLSVVSNFFTEGDTFTDPKVDQGEKLGYLLNSTGLSLFAIGKPSEAEGLFKKALQVYIEAEDWKGASVAYEDLVAVQFRLGKLKEAQDTAGKSHEVADRAGDPRYIAILKAWYDYLLFCQGETEKSKGLFEEADKIYEELWPNVGGLYGVFWEGYAKFLITTGRAEDAHKKNIRNLKYFTDNNLPAHISRCHRSLAELERIKGNFVESKKYLDESLKIARKIGIQFLEIDSLIELGRLGLETKDYRGAESDLKEAIKLVVRTGFKLYAPVAEVVLAKVCLALRDFDRAMELAESAYEKAEQMNYHWSQVDAEKLLNTIKKGEA